MKTQPELKYCKLDDTFEINSFSCGDSKEHICLNNFLIKKAKIQQKDFIGTTIVAFDDSKKIVGYITLLANSLKVETENKNNFFKKILMSKNYDYETFPSLMIGRLAVNKEYQKGVKGINVGTFLFKLAIGYAVKSNEFIGIRFIVVDAKEMSRNWYINKLKFKQIDKQDLNYLFYDIKGWSEDNGNN